MEKMTQKVMNISIVSVLLVLSYITTNIIGEFNTIQLNVPHSWGLYFQNSGNNIAASIVELHGFIFIFLIGILSIVTIWLGILVASNWGGKTGFSYKYLTHHTLLEIIWTATPTIILVFIGIPSVDLLYLSDLSSVEIPYEGASIKVIGNQWYWSYNYNINPTGLLTESDTESDTTEILNTLFSDDSDSLSKAQSIIGDKELVSLPSSFGTIENLEDFSITVSEEDDKGILSSINTIIDQTIIASKENKIAAITAYLEELENGNLSYQYDSYIVPVSDIDEDSDLIKYLDVDNAVIIPQNLPIRMLFTSADVIHDFAVPALGVKIDCNPGRINALNIQSNRLGAYYGQCSELCGVAHSEMPIRLETVDQDLWNKFIGALILNAISDDIEGEATLDLSVAAE